MSRIVKKRTLLHDEKSVVIQPEIVRRLGNLADAAVLQQLNYRMAQAKVEHAGRLWVYKSYDNWAEEIGITGQQVRRSVERLEALGVISSCVPRGRTKHYAINYDHPLLDGATTPDTNQANSPDNQANSPDDGANSPAYIEVQEKQRDNTLAAAPRESVKPKTPRPPDLLWDTMVQVCGLTTATMPASERGRTNKALAELRAIGATPDDIRAKAAAYRKVWPQATLTPTALTANWSTLDARPGPVRRPTCDLCQQRLDIHDEEICLIIQRGGI